MNHKFATILLAILLILVFVGQSAFSGDNARVNNKQELSVVTPEVDAQWEAKLKAFIESGATLKRPHSIIPSANTAAVVTDTVGKTTYDFGGNSCLGRRLALSPPGLSDGLHFAYMARTTGSNADRYATYNFYDRNFGIFFSPYQFSSYAGSGWASVVDGQNHEALMVFHWSNSATGLVTTHFVKDDDQAAYGFSTDVEVDTAGLWPGIAAQGDTIFITNTPDPDRIPGNTFYSLDYGATWTQSGFPTPPSPAAVNFENPESWPEFNPANPSEIGFALLQEEEPTPSGTNYQGGVAWSTTNDLGATWNSMTVYDFGTVLPGNFAYLPQTLFQHTFYTQIMNAYSDNGIGHVVFNGSGFQVAGADTFSIYPVVYWNTQQQQLIELTADSVARNPAISDTVLALFPYRCIGNSWPHIATGPDGLVAVVWQQIEMVDSTNVRVVYGTLGATSIPFYATDIYCAVSSDYGQTWSQSFKVGGETGECDMYPILARKVEKDANDNYFIHFMYLWDTNPGGSLASPSETDFSECAWIYKMVDITPYIVGINSSSDNLVTDFMLAQNYPNPFNPSTTINFNIQKRTKVTLDIYNTLGQKVATVLNEVVNPGAHNVEFDGSDLSSGVYFYQLTADNFKSTRKMVLMK